MYVQDSYDIKIYPAQMHEGKAIPEKNTVATISITLDYTAGLFGGNSLIFFLYSATTDDIHIMFLYVYLVIFIVENSQKSSMNL